MTRRLTDDERIELTAIVHTASNKALGAVLDTLGVADQFPDAGVVLTDAELDELITGIEEAL